VTPAGAEAPGVSAVPSGAAVRTLKRVYVWQAPVRLAHWLIFLSVVVLSATGFYIGSPFLVVAGEARQHFVTGLVKLVHSYAAIVFTLSLVSRLVWMFAGNAYARWDQFIPRSRERWQRVLKMTLYYLFLTRRPTREAGHNALAGLTYALVYALLLLQALTGLGLYGKAAHVGSPMRWFGFLANVFGGPQYARWLHHGFMWLLLGFVVHHLYSALLFSFEERMGTMESIFSGYKFVGPGDAEAPGTAEPR
jgi:Ni/Fe-hydrogenase 1 B-type cytochrome subunit